MTKRYNQLSNTSKGIVLASMTALLWAFLAIVLKITVTEVEPVTVAWFRFIVAFILLFVYLSFRNRNSIRILGNPPILAIVAAVGLALNYVGYIKGVELTTPSNAQILIQIAPILLAITGLIFFKEKLTGIQVVGFLLAITGFSIFYRDQLANLLTSSEIYNTGILTVIASAFAWAVYGGLQKLLVKKYTPQSLNLIIYGVPTILLIPYIEVSDLWQLSPAMWLLMIFLGVNTFFAYGFLAEAFKHIEANKVAIIITLNPIITIVTMLILGFLEVTWIQPERISIYGIAGALFVVAGAILAVRSKKPKPMEDPDIKYKQKVNSLSIKT